VGVDPHEGMWRHSERKFTVDLVVVAEEHLLVVRRRYPPFKGGWALPGGEVDPDESFRDAARRELLEETGLDVPAEALTCTGVYSQAGRDPRGPTSSAAWLVRLRKRCALRAGDDAAAAAWWLLAVPPEPLAFDHDRIVHEALRS
jgi:8-oxo-dGTP diphosphatase